MDRTIQGVRFAGTRAAVQERGFAPRAVRRRLFATVLVVSDATMLVVATMFASLVRFRSLTETVTMRAGAAGTPTYLEMSAAMTVLWLMAMFAGGLYDLDRLSWGSGEFSRVVRALSLGTIGFVVVTFVAHSPDLSREWLLLAWVLSMAMVIPARAVLRLAAGALRRKTAWMRQPALIVGSNVEAADVARMLGADPSCGLVPVGCLGSSRKDKLSLDYCAPGVPRLGSAHDLVRVVREHDIDTVVLIASAFDCEVLRRMIADLRGLPVSIHLSFALSEVITRRVLVRQVSGMPLISLKGVSLSAANLRTKRLFDLVVAWGIVLAGMPLWAGLAAAIKLTSEGPVFYRQPRVGKDGQPFEMYKFRSMVADADARLTELRDANEADGPLFKMHDDPRVTPLGKWMRKFSVDEFPQLINVIKGEMSLVGPRPPLEHETREYTEHDWRRLEVVPGMTGLWQVSGRSNLTFQEMVRLDLFYIDNWSVTLDLALMARTVPSVVLGGGAY